METCLCDQTLTWCLTYLGDIIMFSKRPKDHPDWLRTVFQKPKEVGLEIEASKCEFVRKTLMYLEHKILERGIKTDDSKIKVI